MSNEELKENLTSPNQWLRLVYMVLFAVLLEIAGFVMLAVIIAQFLFAIFTGSANDNLRRLGDQIATYIYQTLQFLIYNTEEKPFPFSEWPESEVEDLSAYESAEEVDGEVIAEVETEVEVETKAADRAPGSESDTEEGSSKVSKKISDAKADEDETVINLGSESASDKEEGPTGTAGPHSSDPDKKPGK